MTQITNIDREAAEGVFSIFKAVLGGENSIADLADELCYVLSKHRLQARREALEEAASVCEKLPIMIRCTILAEKQRDYQRQVTAEAIRQLKGEGG